MVDKIPIPAPSVSKILDVFRIRAYHPNKYPGLEFTNWRDDPCLSMRNGRFPIIDITQKANGDTVILTGDGVGNMLRYTFTEC